MIISNFFYFNCWRFFCYWWFRCFSNIKIRIAVIDCTSFIYSPNSCKIPICKSRLLLHFGSGFACAETVICSINIYIPKRIGDSSIIIISHKTTDIIGSCYASCTIRICDGSIIISHKTADIKISIYASCAIRIGNNSIHIESHNTADRIISIYASCAIRIGNGSKIIPHNTADIIISIYASCAIRIGNGSKIIPHNTADIIISCYSCINYTKIFYFSCRIYITKQTNTISSTWAIYK